MRKKTDTYTKKDKFLKFLHCRMIIEINPNLKIFFSKRSPMPSLQETVTPDVEYVNTDVISEIIKQDHPDIKNAASIAVTEIIQKEDNHVCNIKIKATPTSTSNEESVPALASSNIKPQQLKISQPAKRSVSSVSSTRPSGLKVCTDLGRLIYNFHFVNI